MIWNVAVAILCVVLAIALSVPTWVRIALVVAALLELGFAVLAHSVLSRRQSAG